LTVGNIRLPTAYDVRRMIRQGTQTQPVNNIQQTYHFAVRSDADVHAVGSHLEGIYNTTVTPGMRSAGQR
jgi:hypothetical protein